MTAILASTLLIAHAYESEEGWEILERPEERSEMARESRMVSDAFDGATTPEGILYNPANADEARTNWTILSRIWHPDKNRTMTEYSSKVFTALKNAYAVFLDPEKEQFRRSDLNHIYEIDVDKFYANKDAAEVKLGKPIVIPEVSAPEEQEQEWIIVKPEPHQMPSEPGWEVSSELMAHSAAQKVHQQAKQQALNLFREAQENFIMSAKGQQTQEMQATLQKKIQQLEEMAQQDIKWEPSRAAHYTTLQKAYRELAFTLRAYLREMSLLNLTESLQGALIAYFRSPDFDAMTGREFQKLIQQNLQRKGVKDITTLHKLMHITQQNMDKARAKVDEAENTLLPVRATRSEDPSFWSSGIEVSE